jgi:hypothetical protein
MTENFSSVLVLGGHYRHLTGPAGVGLGNNHDARPEFCPDYKQKAHGMCVVPHIERVTGSRDYVHYMHE